MAAPCTSADGVGGLLRIGDAFGPKFDAIMATTAESSTSGERDETLCVATFRGLDNDKTDSCYYLGSTHKGDQSVIEWSRRDSILNFSSPLMNVVKLLVIDWGPHHFFIDIPWKHQFDSRCFRVQTSHKEEKNDSSLQRAGLWRN